MKRFVMLAQLLATCGTPGAMPSRLARSVLLSAMVDNSDLPVALDCGLSFRRFGTHDVP